MVDQVAVDREVVVVAEVVEATTGRTVWTASPVWLFNPSGRRWISWI